MQVLLTVVDSSKRKEKRLTNGYVCQSIAEKPEQLNCEFIYKKKKKKRHMLACYQCLEVSFYFQ